MFHCWAGYLSYGSGTPAAVQDISTIRQDSSTVMYNTSAGRLVISTAVQTIAVDGTAFPLEDQLLLFPHR